MQAKLLLPMFLAVLLCAGCLPHEATVQSESASTSDVILLGRMLDVTARKLGMRRQMFGEGMHSVYVLNDHGEVQPPQTNTIRRYLADYDGTIVTFDAVYNPETHSLAVQAMPELTKSADIGRRDAALMQFVLGVQNDFPQADVIQ